MKLDVQDEILDQATQCKHNCICQGVGGKPHCRISDTVNGSVFFTPTRHPMGCPYQCSFGSTFMCTCPVRQEIYKQYRI
jgi:hypothetical protein